jgi:hypothetical protein
MTDDDKYEKRYQTVKCVLYAFLLDGVCFHFDVIGSSYTDTSQSIKSLLA